ncbi:class I SAM-dependent methyltransferase [Mycobacterium sp. CBMA271]|uniref:cyclopropane mycolic acid synthase family methyltransferase n=1 Tax=unclassified Mycobacteroides TaxID=2618759 RepID=UPI0012DD6260|nr:MULTISPECIES: cyclopropane mycolic acid synthase family methyltransferase [unclassified Mycobacteroides]MUM18300.1 SAM-dependent methyltransferase [Mycobacteroides sp. CBMA 326]MUM20886.1 class I SAM-dependent methyltransferase [Mycobacteroides sp. CBMA 271]
MSKLTPKFSDVQAHYDLSDEFFALFLDPSRTYSCAYFEPDTLTLEQAQRAKIDLALGKLGLEPGMTLLDVGCGWGSTMKRALEHYDVNVIGLTLSKNQFAYVTKLLDTTESSRSHEVRLAGWEEFEGRVDRIVSIGAFEHFGFERYDSFFEMAHRAMPAEGKMLLHTLVSHHPDEWKRMGIPLLMSRVRFIYFIGTEIFPGGRLPSVPIVDEHATRAAFTITRHQSLQPHYARTLDCWSENLAARKDEAISLQSQEVYDRYIKYLTGAADGFRDRWIDVVQFTCEK